MPIQISALRILKIKDSMSTFLASTEVSSLQKETIFQSLATLPILPNITKGLYADVSEKCSSTPVRVERNIRHAIEIGFLKGNLEMIKKIFTSSNYSDKGAPTNSNFLAAIYYYMVNNEL